MQAPNLRFVQQERPFQAEKNSEADKSGNIFKLNVCTSLSKRESNSKQEVRQYVIFQTCEVLEDAGLKDALTFP